MHGVDRLVYGALLVLFIMYLPRGIVGESVRRRKLPPAAAGEPRKPRHATG
jgi:hypothetical protein